jgi:hypothetical protein
VLDAQRFVLRTGFMFPPKRASRPLGAALSIAVSISVWGGFSSAVAQDSSRAILGLGNAVVTGFSGVRPPPTPLPPNVDPIERTYIDLDRPSARVINIDALLGPPAAQLLVARKPFSVTAAQVGQVFSIALDDATPPNVYLAATSAYGLPIVVPDRDGDGRPDRSRRGAPNANFMPGLFGPVTVNGGPGSIWKIDGRNGAVTLFANVTLDGAANSGAALGGLAFDSASRQLFVADRNTGMIHRFGLDGADRGRFDHGADALRTAGLAQVPFDPRNRLDVTNSAFDSGDPGTWAYAPPARRVFALAVRGDRLFYAVAAGLQVWSVSITRTGGFGSDARLELNVPPGRGVAEISNIVFDDQGHMIVAERGAPTGAYDYVALAAAGENRVLRFRAKRPDDPPGPGLWHPVSEEYAIGFPPDFRNDNGGLAVGYGYGTNGAIDRTVCGGTLWSTGEQLRSARDPAIISRLQAGGPLVVNGLQGNAIPLVRPQNEPPFASYFIDYDDRFDDPAARGHLGDVEIWRVCGQAAAPIPVAPPLACPAGWFNVGGVCVTGQACPRGTEFVDGCCVYKDCPPSYVNIGGRCVPPPVLCKAAETYADGKCQPAMCPPGLVVKPPKNGAANGLLDGLKKSSTTNGPAQNGITRPPSNGVVVICPDGKPAVNGQCVPAGDGGRKMCAGYCGCPDGTKADEKGNCVRTPPPQPTLCPVPPFTIVGGTCCTGARAGSPNLALTCFTKPAGAVCGPGAGPVNATTCCAPTGYCPAPTDVCAEGTVRVCRGDGPLRACSCAPVKEDCPPAERLRGNCLPPPSIRCPEGTSLVCNERDRCTCQPPATTPPPTTITCPPDTVKVCRGDSPDETKDCGCSPRPTTTECPFPSVLVDGVCCKFGDYQAGTCGTKPPPPVRRDCSIQDQLRGVCAPPPPPPARAAPPPAETPGAQLGVCPSPFRMVGTSCCNLFTAGSCFSNSSGVSCPSDYTAVGDGLSAQCCRQSAVRCTTRSANASCASGEVPVEDGTVSACCRPDPAGSCTPPSTPTPNPPSATGGWPERFPDLCKDPLIGAIFCRPWLPPMAGQCKTSVDCPSSMVCVEGSCIEGSPPESPPSATGGWPEVPTPSLSCARDADCPSGKACREGVCRDLVQPNVACAPPSVLVNGNCCAPEAVAAGTCGAQPPPPGGCPAGLFPSNDGKTCCTKEQITRETCGTAPPAAPQKAKTTTKPKTTIPAKPKEIVCQNGFHLEGGRCVRDSQPQAVPGLDIRFGIGIGGGGRPGGGGSPKPSPPKPN